MKEWEERSRIKCLDKRLLRIIALKLKGHGLNQ